MACPLLRSRALKQMPAPPNRFLGVCDGAGAKPWRLNVSVTVAPWGLSNPMPRPWVITVIVLVLIAWNPVGQIASAYADAVVVVGLLAACGGTAAKCSNRPRPHMTAKNLRNPLEQGWRPHRPPRP